MITIRPAVADDYEMICQLFALLDAYHARLLPDIFQETDCHVRPYHYIADLIDQPETIFYVAEEGGTGVGFVQISLEEAADLPFFRRRRYAVVHNLVVREENRRRGIGHLLLDAAHQWAKAQGAVNVELSVWMANQTAVTFYENEGYSPILVRLSRPLDT